MGGGKLVISTRVFLSGSMEFIKSFFKIDNFYLALTCGMARFKIGDDATTTQVCFGIIRRIFKSSYPVVNGFQKM